MSLFFGSRLPSPRSLLAKEMQYKGDIICCTYSGLTLQTMVFSVNVPPTMRGVTGKTSGLLLLFGGHWKITSFSPRPWFGPGQHKQSLLHHCFL